MDIQVLNSSIIEEWDDYVWASSDANHFHLSGWKSVMEAAFDHNPHYLLAKDGNQVQGILPLIPISSRLTGRYVTSLPGGICASNEEAADLLIHAAIDFVKRVQADYLILRDSFIKWASPDLITNDDHCTFEVELDEDPDKIWRGVNRRTRQSINRAYQADLKINLGKENLDIYYPIYSQALQEKGTPSQGLTFFKHLIKEFPSIFNLFVVRRDTEILGGGFVAIFKDTIFNTWSGMPRQYYNFNTGYFLYWETLKFGCENGFQRVDLGRSKWESGVYKFKKQWRGNPKPLYQQYYLNGISQPPAVGNQRSDQLQYRIFTDMWKRLPFALTEIVGTQLRKRMPFG